MHPIPRKSWAQSIVLPAARSGVYAVFLDGKVAYIGQSEDMRARLGSYSLDASIAESSFKGVQFVSMDLDYHYVDGAPARLKLETELIDLFQPRLNVIGIR